MSTTPKSPNTETKYSAPALEKGLDIIELLATQDKGLSQTDMARSLDRSVSEIFRMLVVLQNRGYIVQDPDSDRYILTTLLFEVAHRTPMIRRLTALAGPLMQKLAVAVNQSVHLSIIKDASVLIIGQVDSPGNNVMSVRLGSKIDIWKATSGRLIMAYLPDDQLEELFNSPPLQDEASKSDIKAQLAHIRSLGYEVQDSYLVKGIVNLATPVIDHSGHAIASMTIPYIERYDDPISYDDCLAQLIAFSHQLSASLGAGSFLKDEIN